MKKRYNRDVSFGISPARRNFVEDQIINDDCVDWYYMKDEKNKYGDVIRVKVWLKYRVKKMDSLEKKSQEKNLLQKKCICGIMVTLKGNMDDDF